MADKELSIKQQKFIAEIVSGKHINEAAKIVDIAEKTAHAWLKLPLVQEEIKLAKQALFDDRLDMLKSGVPIALKTLLKHMNEENTPAQVQVRSAEIWLKHSIEIHKMQEVDNRIVELEKEVMALKK